MTDDELGEWSANTYQRISALETLVRNMTVLRTDEGINDAAHEIALRIEDLFAIGGHGVLARREHIKTTIRDGMRQMLQGERHWNHQ